MGILNADDDNGTEEAAHLAPDEKDTSKPPNAATPRNAPLFPESINPSDDSSRATPIRIKDPSGLEGFANSPLAGEGEEGGSGGDDSDEDEGVEMRVLLR